ncbi:putative transcription factor bHLH041 [Setaria italica]|uniref:putative transcription factor bHLH041 n=1 Tax=Setaria italica TaxID=4555 RepID=UPI000BE4F83D|nr:putative transcription factor bHLH041 [Setaria italica]
MDAIFALAAGPRARVLERAATRIPGCLYIFLWAPVIAGHLPPSLFRCVDAWISNTAAPAGGDRAREVFEAYRRSFCAIVSGCVPGWAYKDGRPYMELPEPDLTASASLQVQQQFYHEAGTKTAVFMSCDHGEIEVGLSSAPAPPAVANHVQESLLEEFMQLTPAVPSSSSSSLPSLSIGSPEYSSLIRSMATTAAAEPSSQERQPLPLHPAVQLPGLLLPVYGHAPFLAPEDEDAAIAEAMLAVISCSAPQPPAPTDVPPSPPWLARHRAQRWSPRRRAPGAFRAYCSALSPRARPRPGAPGQRMAKTAIALMLSVHMAMRDRELAAARRQEDAAAGQPPAPQQQQHTSSQLHHMISERRRRERLNESFQTLRALLPPGSKKDKATVLANTTEYMHKLIADVADLEKKNRHLEAQIGLPLETQQAGSDDSSERVQVDVTTGASTSTSTSAAGQAQEVSIRVTVRAECDLPEVVIAILARIKKMGRFAVVTVDARQRSSRHAQVSITLRLTAGSDEADETSLKEAVAKAVEDAVARPPSPP